MTIRLNFIRETELARLYETSDGEAFWIPKSVVKSTTRFPNDNPQAFQVHELNIEDWWWDKYEDERERE